MSRVQPKAAGSIAAVSTDESIDYNRLLVRCRDKHVKSGDGLYQAGSSRHRVIELSKTSPVFWRSWANESELEPSRRLKRHGRLARCRVREAYNQIDWKRFVQEGPEQRTTILSSANSEVIDQVKDWGTWLEHSDSHDIWLGRMSEFVRSRSTYRAAVPVGLWVRFVSNNVHVSTDGQDLKIQKNIAMLLQNYFSISVIDAIFSSSATIVDACKRMDVTAVCSLMKKASKKSSKKASKKASSKTSQKGSSLEKKLTIIKSKAAALRRPSVERKSFKRKLNSNLKQGREKGLEKKSNPASLAEATSVRKGPGLFAAKRPCFRAKLKPKTEKEADRRTQVSGDSGVVSEAARIDFISRKPASSSATASGWNPGDLAVWRYYHDRPFKGQTMAEVAAEFNRSLGRKNQQNLALDYPVDEDVSTLSY